MRSKKRGDDSGFDNDFAVEGEGGDQAARVDGEVFRGARGVEVDDDFFKRDVEFGEGDVGALGPWRKG